jgi:hypothetical protein
MCFGYKDVHDNDLQAADNRYRLIAICMAEMSCVSKNQLECSSQILKFSCDKLKRTVVHVLVKCSLLM